MTQQQTHEVDVETTSHKHLKRHIDPWEVSTWIKSKFTFDFEAEEELESLKWSLFAPDVHEGENEAISNPVNGEDGSKNNESAIQINAEPQKVCVCLFSEDFGLCAW